jgi:hypothetical protein
MTDQTPFPIWVCVDCLMLHANGETAENPDMPPLGLLEGQEVTLGILKEQHRGCDDDCTDCETQEFSWCRCEGCGSSLGGSRHAMTVWE